MDEADFRLEILVIRLHYEEKIHQNHENTQTNAITVLSS